MNKVRIAINGFGRIGRIFLRSSFMHPQIDIVAINDLTDSRTLAHLLKYDSVHRAFPGEVSHNEEGLLVNDKFIKVINSKDPAQLPWKELNIDIVIESTGLFLDKESAQKHLRAGAKKVILSAPPRDNT